MKRICDVLGNPNWRKRLGAVFACATAALSLPAQTFTTLNSFDYVNGECPLAGLVQGTDGNFYGTTQSGGTNGGVVFKITPTGTLTALHSFAGGTEGAIPFAGLMLSTNGDFYGTTYYGGSSDVGTIFRITLGGRLTTLYSFCSQSGCAGGHSPYAAPIEAANGTLYGLRACAGPTAVGRFTR